MSDVGIRCKMNLKIIKANSEVDKVDIERLLKNKEYDKLQKYVIQENEWIEW